MRFIKKLPRNAKFIYKDKGQCDHYEGKTRTYVVWENKNGKSIASYKNDETF